MATLPRLAAHRWCCHPLLLVALATSGCDRAPDDGLTKFPVSGTVLVNGQPTEDVVVRFYHNDRTVQGNAARPAGITDSDGKFKLSTNGLNDGAVAGNYQVTFMKMSDNSPNAKDIFGGQFSNRETSPFTAQVQKGSNELPPFELNTGDKPRD